MRSRGCGEAVDRAVTLYVRHFVPIVIVLAAAIVPLVASEWTLFTWPGTWPLRLRRGSSAALDDLQLARAVGNALNGDSPAVRVTVLLFIVSMCVRLLEWSAMLTVVSTAYAGATTTLGQAYRVGLRRWPQQLLLAIVRRARRNRRDPTGESCGSS